ncbi:MAG: thymidylate kinase [Bacteroidales bacterium]|jgi:dTMP kinase|nr:thymidylate kinase [Bacteroidales bacterium]MCI2121359.1 thymidylate kinase [Bacteroidales bacterium]MCI2145240.1 thymidylate kinase [Bacteroidales bacterium]
MLIVLEGLDGAGKSTQVKLLDMFLSEKGKHPEYMHFPRFDATVFGEMIAGYLRGEYGGLNDVHPQLVALLYAEDRRDAAPQIRKWLGEGRDVILDRYVGSNIAFQCARSASEDDATALEKWILELEYGAFGIPEADVGLFLDVPIEFISARLGGRRDGADREYLRGKQDIYEAEMEFQEKVRGVYLRQCEEGLLKRIDCSADDGTILSAETVFDKIKMSL